MYSRLLKLLNDCDGRYPTADEHRQIAEFAASIPRRLQAVKQLEQQEAEILAQSLAEMKRKYPAFGGSHQQPWEKYVRDAQLVLRYIAQGLVADDQELATTQTYVWVRSMLKAFTIPPQMVRDAYATLREQCRRHLPAEVFRVFEPHLDKAVVDLSDVQTPIGV